MCSCCPSLSPSLLIEPWDVEYVSAVLFCFILDIMLCVCEKKKKKLLITKKNKLDDNDVEHEQECGDTISVSKDSYFNLKRHIMRKHDSVLCEHGEARAKREHFEYG